MLYAAHEGKDARRWSDERKLSELMSAAGIERSDCGWVDESKIQRQSPADVRVVRFTSLASSFRPHDADGKWIQSARI